MSSVEPSVIVSLTSSFPSISTLCGIPDSFMNSIVTSPAAAVSSVWSNARSPPGSAVSMRWVPALRPLLARRGLGGRLLAVVVVVSSAGRHGDDQCEGRERSSKRRVMGLLPGMTFQSSYAPGCEMDDESCCKNRRPGHGRLGDRERRDLERGRAALHELLEPEVLQGVRETVDEHQRHVEARTRCAGSRNAAWRPRESASATSASSVAVEAVVVPQMHGGQRRVAGLGPRDAGEEERAENGDVVEVEADCRGEPREAGEDDDHRHDEASDVPAAPERPRRADAAPAQGQDGEPERDQGAGGGERVGRLDVEVPLLHDPRPDDDDAENRGDDGDDRHPVAQPVDDDGEDRDGHERRGIAGEDDHAPETALEPAVAHVVELVERQARVGDENRQGDQA